MTTIYKIKELGLLTIEAATGKARDLLDAAKRQLGFVPNMYGAMANEPALLEAYSTTYAAFRRDAGFTSIEQELIFLVISRANGCHYCMAAHSFVADKMSKVPTEVTDAIRDGRAIPDSRLQALATFTHVMVEMRGLPSEGAVREFLAAGYSEKNILGVILAIGVKTWSNYANHLFHTPVDDVFASRVWKEAA
ncbi:carboxymuconolactone decarboxylase family protein [Methylosinus sp. Sm6]|uniref:carboxymuconolactone decarboxylase family protein n=1 Tax=Methylosinus sp. Sm6 TaxID=2866948 RepID=UPI001C9999F6|nr:carboxymuconolactone decarboxylase family protein [Methylosinus sp. Sm6]